MDTDFSLYFKIAEKHLSHIRRKCLIGNQFRHQMLTFTILLQYFSCNVILLKASIIHDLLEDDQIEDNIVANIINADSDGRKVLRLVQEVSRKQNINETESKKDFLKRIFSTGSINAKILKIAARIANLSDLAYYTIDKSFAHRYLTEAQEFIIPYASSVHFQMAEELNSLVELNLRCIQNLGE